MHIIKSGINTAQPKSAAPEKIDLWEAQLDALGPHAGFEALVSHYEKGDPEAPSYQYLGDYLTIIQPPIKKVG